MCLIVLVLILGLQLILHFIYAVTGALISLFCMWVPQFSHISICVKNHLTKYISVNFWVLVYSIGLKATTLQKCFDFFLISEENMRSRSVNLQWCSSFSFHLDFQMLGFTLLLCYNNTRMHTHTHAYTQCLCVIFRDSSS